jgi:3'-phosphoadenosine 5'-phosphosulfate sulfotransferase (PAPS reductase)/FAD synthetase
MDFAFFGIDGLDLLDRAVAEYHPVAVFALFSGGYDSLCATHLAAQHPRFTGAGHIKTGIGVEETREYVRQTAADQGWPLLEYQPPVSYEALVLKHGFPGPGAHALMYRNLKERCVRQLIRDHKTAYHQSILLVTGARRQESSRRMGRVQAIQKIRAQVWMSLIHDWSKADVLAYVQNHSLPRNPVVDVLHHSCECLCGAFAREGEREEIAFWYPKTADHISRLEAKVKAAGQSGCVWAPAAAARDNGGSSSRPLCASCG